MLTRIHVNQHKIRSNAKHGTDEPVLTVKTYKSNTYGKEVLIRDPQGCVVARVVYQPDNPLPCGARVWIETQMDVEVRGSGACQLAESCMPR